jgi:hypothetical protein
MTQWWVVEQLAEQRRRELAKSFRPKGARRNHRKGEASAMVTDDRAAANSTTGRAHSGTAPARWPVGHYVGNWLIRAGTRLGGSSLRTS